MEQIIDDVRIRSLHPLISPAILMEELPLTKHGTKLVIETREEVSRIIKGEDDRLLVVVGPCSIHDVTAAREYATHLQTARKKFAKELCLIMRVYFEKPRTTVGWKGLINDPYLDNTFKINDGLRLARKLLVDLAEMGVPSGTEFLDTIVPQFISDAISWGAIGARTTESQIHRELASGLSMPVGFKNGTDGNIQIAIDAIYSARNPHRFLSVTKQGISAIVSTNGNDSCHLILRGSTSGPNYYAENITQATQELQKKHLNSKIMVDCSHGNSQKDHTRQSIVVDDIVLQLSKGSSAIAGIMLESNLQAGNQPLLHGKKLKYGQSITDACIDWQETFCLLEKLASAVKMRRKIVRKGYEKTANHAKRST